MISNKTRESRRGRALKMPKNIERLYREGKCSECSVVVTRMDFAKILGKFTKVKIRYERNSTPKGKKNSQLSPNSNARLKSNENGMVLIHRNAYNQHPVRERKIKSNDTSARGSNISKENSKFTETSTPRQVNNILRENNRLKRAPTWKEKNNIYYDGKSGIHSNLKQYGIVFVDPNKDVNHDLKNVLSLTELLPSINKSMLPSEEWCLDYLPNSSEPKEDKVYDRIAAELEDLMYSETPTVKSDAKADTKESKIDDFPNIMDILNEDTRENTHKPNNQSNSTEFKTSLESSDVEAMLLGKSNEISKDPTPMEVDSTDVSNLIDDVVQLNVDQEGDVKLQEKPETDAMDNPHSPSILDEALQKGIEEHLPLDQSLRLDSSTELDNTSIANDMKSNIKKDDDLKSENKDSDNNNTLNISTITHVVFKKIINGKCYKSVTCPKNLKYSVELEGKPVEFLGAPKFISSLEDLKVLLQIVNESELDSLYVLY